MEQRLKYSADSYRRKFGTSLVGRWSTCVGTFSCVMDQIWEFYPDGTGKFTDTGPFGHPRSETQFDWRQLGALQIELRLSKFISFDEEYADELEDDKQEWQIIHYDFKEVRTEFGIQIALYDIKHAGSKFEGFSESMAPLSYLGVVDKDGA